MRNYIKLNKNSISAECDGMALIKEMSSGWEELIPISETKGSEIGASLPIDWDGEWELICFLKSDCPCDNCAGGFPRFFN